MVFTIIQITKKIKILEIPNNFDNRDPISLWGLGQNRLLSYFNALKLVS